jgi:hypothetical protein
VLFGGFEGDDVMLHHSLSPGMYMQRMRRNGPVVAPDAIFASPDSAAGGSAATVIVTGPAAPVTVPRVQSRLAGDWSVCLL